MTLHEFPLHEDSDEKGLCPKFLGMANTLHTADVNAIISTGIFIL